MKPVFDIVALMLLCMAALGLVFLFQGSPDLWDVLHEKAMAAAKEQAK